MPRHTKRRAKGSIRSRPPMLSKVLPPDEIHQFNRVVDAADLTGVHLVDSSVQMDLSEITPTMPKLVVYPPMFRASFSEKTRILYCGVKLGLHMPGKGEKPCASVTAEYSLFYKLDDGVPCSEDVAVEFAGRTGVFNAWPFFRELAFSMGARMGLPPFVLPLFKLPLQRPVPDDEAVVDDDAHLAPAEASPPSNRRASRSK